MRPFMKYGLSSTGRRQKAENDNFRLIVAKITTQRSTKLAEETEIGDTTGLRPMYENEAI